MYLIDLTCSLEFKVQCQRSNEKVNKKYGKIPLLKSFKYCSFIAKIEKRKKLRRNPNAT